MEQKTEASQAVDEPVLPHLPRAVGYRHTMDNTEGLKGNKPVVVFGATKPNPFGIPGLDYSASFPVTTETLFTANQMKAYARAALKAQPAPTEAQVHETVQEFFAPIVLSPACGCAKCNPRAVGRMMILCAICGNKRCPHASDHGFICTSSNEPGQVGIPYDQGRARASAETGGVSRADLAKFLVDAEPGDAS